MRILRLSLVVCLGLGLWVLPVWGQTAATAAVQGTVVDQQGAVVSGAEVTLVDLATSVARTVKTNENGQYIFTSVTPGVYKITASAPGFRQAVVPAVKVDVAKSYTVNFTLEVGEIAETVEVTAGAGVELQTLGCDRRECHQGRDAAASAESDAECRHVLHPAAADNALSRRWCQ
jgi:hypothetical protein